MRRRDVAKVERFEIVPFVDDLSLPLRERLARYDHWFAEFESVRARAAAAGVTLDIEPWDAPFDPDRV